MTSARNNRSKVAFIANKFELWNALLPNHKSYFFKKWAYLHENPQNVMRLGPWEIAFAAFVTLIETLNPLPEHADRFVFSGKETDIYLVRIYRWHLRVAMLSALPIHRPYKYVGIAMALFIKAKLLIAAFYVSLRGADVEVFGAATKDQSLTEGCKMYVRWARWLGWFGMKNVTFAHGDTLTAMATILQIERVTECAELPKEAFITGSTSKTGSIVALALAREGYKVYMLTENPKRLDAIRAKAGEFARNLVHASSLDDGKNCRLWIIGKDKNALELIDRIPLDSYVLAFAVPDPLTPELLLLRPDIVHIDAGLLEHLDSSGCEQFHQMRLRSPFHYACNAWCLTLVASEFAEMEVGEVDESRMERYRELASHFFRLPSVWTSHLRPVDMPVSTPDSTGRRRLTPPHGVDLEKKVA